MLSLLTRIRSRAVADQLARVGAGVKTMNRLLRQIYLAGLLIALASSRGSGSVRQCDFESPFLGKALGLTVLWGPPAQQEAHAPRHAESTRETLTVFDATHELLAMAQN